MKLNETSKNQIKNKTRLFLKTEEKIKIVI